MGCFISTPGRIRTCDLRIRSPLLYPTELRAQLAEKRLILQCFYGISCHRHILAIQGLYNRYDVSCKVTPRPHRNEQGVRHHLTLSRR